MPEADKSLDVLGVKPVADALKAVTDGSVQGVSSLLSRICLPAAEEFGLLWRDKVSHWRACNAAKMAAQAASILDKNTSAGSISAHPRVVFRTIEDSSWTDDDVVLSLWGGLLASSCTESGTDESNLMFINLLSQLTSSQVRIIKYACEQTKVCQSPSGWIMPSDLKIEAVDLALITEISDMHQLDRELDHLRHLGLIETGFIIYSTVADITPTSLALQLYVRSQGYIGSPIEYFELRGPVEIKYPSDFMQDEYPENLDDES